LLLTLCLTVLPSPTVAQAPALTAGLVGGYTSTEHVWSPSADTERVGGVLVGGFVDVQTPLDWLTAGVEMAYTQRGSDVLLGEDDAPSPGGIRTDFLTFAVRARAGLGLGRARFHVVAGPVADFVVRSRLDPLLGQVLDEERQAPFGVVVGAGAGLRITDTVVADVEARLTEGLQSSYAGDLISARHRSQELVLRVGMLVGP
jgi:opacity protein-like surface antigen